MKWWPVLLLIAATAQGDDWGRLFFTQQERQLAQAASAGQHEVVQYNGLIQTPRRKIYWVNGQIASPPASLSGQGNSSQ
ncbi:hypothetical protein [Chitinibacter sp. S2-10]|uniref:hypothetical protein n=1 Tax=Chitinibacter sp. S2-10 TaxID=3373597 RepID=UPI0039779162